MDNVKLERDGVIATVTLNRPDRRNSLSDPMLTDLGAAFSELRDDTSTRVVIVTGAPPIFSAGADAPISAKMTPEATTLPIIVSRRCHNSRATAVPINAGMTNANAMRNQFRSSVFTDLPNVGGARCVYRSFSAT